MGQCTSAKKQNVNHILIVELSVNNQESDKGLAKRLVELLKNKGVEDYAYKEEISSNNSNIKISLETNKNDSSSRISLCSGKNEINTEQLESIANEIVRKIKNFDD